MLACERYGEQECPRIVHELLRRSSLETRRITESNGWTAIDGLVHGTGNPAYDRLPASTPWKNCAIWQLLLSGYKRRNAPLVLPIAVELMALQEHELEKLKKWPSTWRGHDETVQLGFERLDAEADERRVAQLKREEARLLQEREREQGQGGGGGGDADEENEEKPCERGGSG